MATNTDTFTDAFNDLFDLDWLQSEGLVKDAPPPSREDLDALLGTTARILDDMERSRKSIGNRINALARGGVDRDGRKRSLGAIPGVPDDRLQRLDKILDNYILGEKSAIAELENQMKQHPLYPWVKAQKGVGLKQAARLIGAIGDPYWNDLHNRPRTVSELWAFCGYSVIEGSAQKRKRGVKGNWSPEAKMRAYLIAAQCVKSGQGGKYESLYRAERVYYENAVHEQECAQCGTKGKPAAVGTPLKAGHKHARALRRVAKEVLKDLWSTSRDQHLAAAVADL